MNYYKRHLGYYAKAAGLTALKRILVAGYCWLILPMRFVDAMFRVLLMAAEHWFPWHHGCVTDPKWRVAASRSVTLRHQFQRRVGVS